MSATTHPLRQTLADIISRIAHHACRQGESGDRKWPPLAELPLPESWRCVGVEFYAEDALAELLAVAMRTTTLRPKRRANRGGRK